MSVCLHIPFIFHFLKISSTLLVWWLWTQRSLHPSHLSILSAHSSCITILKLWSKLSLSIFSFALSDEILSLKKKINVDFLSLFPHYCDRDCGVTASLGSACAHQALMRGGNDAWLVSWNWLAFWSRLGGRDLSARWICNGKPAVLTCL